MMRSLWLVPSSRLFSNNCTSTGADTEIQPDTSAFSGGVSGTTTDAVVPASTVTLCLTDPSALSTLTVCVPGARSLTIAGDGPRGTPSTVTTAPAGSVRICSWPVAHAVFASSTYCEAFA